MSADNNAHWTENKATKHSPAGFKEREWNKDGFQVGAYTGPIYLCY